MNNTRLKTIIDLACVIIIAIAILHIIVPALTGAPSIFQFIYWTLSK